jgi:lipopolysaccharide/colanic/teichoic acid biosynthesis glycosyltransferase
MSFIGPRPERPVFVEQFKQAGVPGNEFRHTVKTGLTGYAQLHCLDPQIEAIHEKTAHDLWYIQHWTPMLDTWLLLRTIAFFAKGLFAKH